MVLLLVISACQGADTIPNPFSFAPVTGAELNTEYTSNPVTVSGINTTTTVSVTAGGALLINGADVGAPITAEVDDTVAVRVISSQQYSTAVSATVTIGGMSSAFSVTTKASPVDTIPNPFSFTPVTGAELSTVHTSNAIIVAGINAPAPISVTVGGTLIINDLEAISATTVEAGDTVAVRLTSSAQYSTAVSATVTIGGVASAFTVTTKAEGATHWRPTPGLTWFWQLTGTIDMTQNVDVYDIDYQVSQSVVEALHAQGKKVIAYVPVGNWEPYRPDSDDFPEEVLCGPIPGWPERYIDIRSPLVVTLIKARIALAAASGFDGIEGDVVDLHLVNTGCAPPISESQMTSYLQDLAAYAHSLGLAYFAKNVPENAVEWSQFTDGAVVEEAYYYNEAAGYMPYVDADKPVFAVEYGPDKPTDTQCADANQRRYALYGTDLGLTGQVYRTCW